MYIRICTHAEKIINELYTFETVIPSLLSTVPLMHVCMASAQKWRRTLRVVVKIVQIYACVCQYGNVMDTCARVGWAYFKIIVMVAFLFSP